MDAGSDFHVEGDDSSGSLTSNDRIAIIHIGDAGADNDFDIDIDRFVIFFRQIYAKVWFDRIIMNRNRFDRIVVNHNRFGRIIVNHNSSIPLP